MMCIRDIRDLCFLKSLLLIVLLSVCSAHHSIIDAARHTLLRYLIRRDRASPFAVCSFSQHSLIKWLGAHLLNRW